MKPCKTHRVGGLRLGRRVVLCASVLLAALVGCSSGVHAVPVGINPDVKPVMPFEPLEGLLSNAKRNLRKANSAASSDKCATAAATSPFSSQLEAVPETMGLRNCLATNLSPVLGALSKPDGKCTLASLMSMFSKENTDMASVMQLFGGLMAGVSDADGAAKVSALLTSWKEDSKPNEGFCSAMNTLVGPCVEALVPAFVKLVDDKAECCDGLKPVFDTLKAFTPAGKSIDTLLFEVVNGVHRMMCAPIGDEGALCGQRLFSFLSDIFSPSEDKSLFGPLFFEAGLPLYTLPAGDDACAALESGEIANQVSNKEGTYKYFSYSCCASGMLSFWETLDEIITHLSGNSVPDLLNLVIARGDDSDRRFAARYEDVRKCSFEQQCKDPAFVLKSTAPAPKANAEAAAAKSSKPKGVKCKEVELCDKDKVCSKVCEEGSVAVAPWVARAAAYQRNVSYEKSLCYTQLPATHNSGTTLARGYGNRDQIMNAYQDPNDADAYVRTNNQYLTLTDQLNLGARLLELDTHYFSGQLHSGHCSRINLSFLDLAFEAMVTEIEKILTNGDEGEEVKVEWGPWLMGCLPAMSGIRAEEQRLHQDSIDEVAKWLKSNPTELILLYTEIGREIYEFDQLDNLLAMYTKAFGDMLFTPSDFEAMGGDWNKFTLSELIKKGKRVIPIATPEPNDMMFKLQELCDGSVNVPVSVGNLPTEVKPNTFWGYEMQEGKLVRAYHSVLRYGGFEEAMLSGKKYKDMDGHPVQVNAKTLPVYAAAGVNLLAADAFDGEVLEGMIWSWAEREPSRGDKVAEISASDGRWYGVENYSTTKYAACVETSNRKKWAVVEKGSACPSGMEKAAPSNGLENALLLAELRKKGSDVTAELPVDVASMPVITEEEEKQFDTRTPSGSKGGNGDNNENSNMASSLSFPFTLGAAVVVAAFALFA